jgi:phospholipid/cholesterol/gamma-HCH transport system substrate-binding protein
LGIRPNIDNGFYKRAWTLYFYLIVHCRGNVHRDRGHAGSSNTLAGVRKEKMKKYSKETVVGIFMLIGLVCVGYMAVKLGKITIFGDDTYVIYARFNKITGLRTGNPVNMLGLEVGRVSGLSIDQDNQRAVVEMKIRNGLKIYDDAIASIKTEGLIGDKYVDIDAGGGGDLLKPGGTITETVSPVDIGELIGKYAFGSVEKK